MKKEELEKKLDELCNIKEELETEEGLLQALIVHGGLKLDNALRTLSIEIESVEDDITYHERELNKMPLSDTKLIDMAIDCFHIAPGFESEDIYYFPIFVYDDLMDDFTPLEQAYMDRSNFDVHNDEYVVLTENNNVLLGLTKEEYIKHLREHERTIVDYYTSFVK